MKLLFGGLIAIILLGLYEYSVYEAVMVVNCIVTTGCTEYNAADFSKEFSHALNGIGGLVSALVIAELAMTEPGKAPVSRAIGSAGAYSKLSWTITIVTTLYLLVWVVTGVVAYVVGTMWYPDVLHPLTDLGQSWLGLAVAAAYAYFGISPEAGQALIQTQGRAHGQVRDHAQGHGHTQGHGESHR
ncbi:MAG: hypothetical protein WAL80_06585 [Xanthobacteraceae bacterium]|jgi:hypothetical protein